MKLIVVLGVALLCQGLTDNAVHEHDTFECEGGRKRIDISKICDGEQDCKDNNDEALCDCSENMPCVKGKCIKNFQLAESHCELCDKGYEHNGEQCQDINECHNVDACPGKGSCLNFKGAYTCVSCPKGFEPNDLCPRCLESANKTKNEGLTKLFLCDDQNECAFHNPCEGQGHCVNRIGDFSCNCPPHHEPHGSFCRATGSQPPSIAIAQNSTIFVYDLRTRKLLNEINVKQPLIDIAAYKDSIFYAFTSSIWEYKLETGSRSLIVEFDADDHNVLPIKKISIDWELKRIYFLTGDSIYVVNFFGRGGPIIENKGLITSIAVDPVARYLFYSEDNLVKRVHLDGQRSSTKVIFESLREVPYENTPTGQALAIDPNLQSVYYINNKVLYTFDYEGQRSLVLKNLASYSVVEPFEDRIYAIYRATATHPLSLPRIGYTIGNFNRSATTIGFKHVKRPTALTIVHIAKFPESRAVSMPCYQQDVCSSGFCFPLPDPQSEGRRCVCARGEDGACVEIPLRDYKPHNSVSAEINSLATRSSYSTLMLVLLTVLLSMRLRVN